MASKATLVVEILADAAKAAQGLNDTASRFQDFATKAAKMFAAAFVVDKAVDGIRKVVTAASDLEQAVGGTDKIFGASATKIHNWASDTSDAIRLPQQQFEQLAVAIGSSLRATGEPMDVIASKTHDLMQISADFAATFGTDIGDTAQAVRAALAGEYDSLQNMGVAISGHLVDLEAQKIAMETGADATSDATKTLAAYNILVEQGALVSGQAATETTTFSGQMDALKEKLDNAAGAIGGPLLGAFGNLIQQAGDLVPTLTNIGTGLATIVSWISQLPTPILVAVGAFAALSKIGIGAMLLSAGAAVRTFVMDLRTAPSAMGAFGGALKSMGAGLAGAGITAGLSLIVAAILSNIQRLQSASNDAKAVLKPVEDALTASGGRWTAAARQLQTSALMGTDAYLQLTKAGVSAHDALEILKGNADIWHDVQMNTPIEDLRNADVDITAIDKLLEYSNALEGNAQQRVANAEAAGVQIDANGQVVSSTEQATRSAKDYSDALKDLQDNAQVKFDMGEGAQLLQDVADKADAAKRSLDLFTTQVDKTRSNINTDDPTVKLAKAFRDLPGLISSSDGAFATVLKNMDDFSAINLTENFAQSGTDVLQWGTDVRSAIDQVVSDTFAATGSMSDARAAADTAIGSAADKLAASMGISRDDALAIIDKVVGYASGAEIPDKTFQVIADDAKAKQDLITLQAVKFDEKEMRFVGAFPAASEVAAELNTKYGLLPPQKFTMEPSVAPGAFGQVIEGEKQRLGISGAGGVQVPFTPKDNGVKQALADIPPSKDVQVNVNSASVGQAQQQVAAIGAQPVTVTLNANTTIAQSAITALVTQTRTLTISVAANTAQADASIRGLISATYSTTVQVKGDNVQAIASIRSVTTGSYQAMVDVRGDNSGAIAAVRSVTTGAYSALVHINGDASGFWSVWNSLPSSRSITVTVNQVQGSVVPSAAPTPPGLRATGLGAPRLSATGYGAPRAVAAGAATNITINAGIGDADEIARKVKRVILDRDRRSGGVVVGEMRSRVGHS